MEQINETGELSDEDEEALGKAIAEFVDDFGPDFDDEGQPLEEGESDRVKSEEERAKPGRTAEARPVTRARGARRRARSRRREEATGIANGWPSKEVKNRIASVKNIHKITRAMEMVAAARLRRAEQRIDQLRPYAQALRKMTRNVAEAAGGAAGRLPVLEEREDKKNVGVLLVTGDRGLAGSFNSQIIRAGVQLRRELEREGKTVTFSVVGRRGASSMRFRDEPVTDDYVGFTDRPAFADAREIAGDLITAYVDEELDRVELIYNRYVSPLTQYVRRQTLLPIQQAEVFGRGGSTSAEPTRRLEIAEAHRRSCWVYEPEPEELLAELVPEYVNLSVFRALLESTASEHGARMTAMRSAAENAHDMIDDLTLEMNRVRQAEITQEILEVVGGAEALG